LAAVNTTHYRRDRRSDALDRDIALAPDPGLPCEQQQQQRAGRAPAPRRRVPAHEPQRGHRSRHVKVRARPQRVARGRVVAPVVGASVAPPPPAAKAAVSRSTLTPLAAARFAAMRRCPVPGRAEGHVDEFADRVARVGHGVSGEK
jgi:hypothetical protein